jgi:hypothetical protein
VNIITVIGFIITTVCFVITILQLYKTKKLTKAAYTAAVEAKSAMKNVIVISDLSTIIKTIQEIENYIRNRKPDSAYLRVNDLMHALVQIKQLIITTNNADDEIKKILYQLSVIKRQLETKINDGKEMDITKVNYTLSEFELILEEITSKIKFPITGGGK